MKAKLFTDGGSRGNPGPAAAGYYIEFEDGRNASGGKYLGTQTNNQAEYQALILGLKTCLSLEITQISVKMDSELIVKQLTGKYRVKESTLKPLFSQILALTNKFKSFNIVHIPRAENECADALVNQVLDRAPCN